MKHLPYLELNNLLKHKFASAEREIFIPEPEVKITRNRFRSAVCIKKKTPSGV